MFCALGRDGVCVCVCVFGRWLKRVLWRSVGAGEGPGGGGEHLGGGVQHLQGGGRRIRACPQPGRAQRSPEKRKRR